MKTPGPIKLGSADHAAVLAYAKALAVRFEISEIAAFGQILKFDEAIGKAHDTGRGMAALKIEVEKGGPNER